MHLSKSSSLRWGLLFGLGLLLFIGFTTWRGGATIQPILEPLPQDPYIQVYFNHNLASTYSEPYRTLDRYGDDLESVLVAAIGKATQSLDIAVHELNLPRVAAALQDRAAAGVAIRLILENTYSQDWGTLPREAGQELPPHQLAKVQDFWMLVDQDRNGQLSPEELGERDALYMLDQAAIPRLDDTADGSKGSGLMHHKFMVVDRRTVVLGSVNWTLSGVHGDYGQPESRGNANALLVIDSPALAELFEDEFNFMWGDGPGAAPDSLFGLQKPPRPARRVSLPGSTVEVQFSPISKTRPWHQSVNGLIAQSLQNARQEVDLALFVFSDQRLSDTLAARAEQGVTVQALIDPGFAYRDYSEALDMLGQAMPNNRCKFESQNQPWRNPIQAVGIPDLPPGDKLHHKFAVIDQQTVIVGSQNWSQAANQTNDEDLLVIHNRTVAAHFQREFDRLYADADLGMTDKLLNKLQERRQECAP